MARTVPLLLVWILIIGAYSDCYFPFLQDSGACSSNFDCDGSPCVMDVKSGSHVCCKRKPGTIAPECPDKMTYSGIPILCDPADGDDGCPAGSTCRISTTDFDKDSASPNSLCCK